MKYELRYPDKYNGVQRSSYFFAPSIEKAQEHADAMCKRRRIPYLIKDANGRVWQRDYSSDRFKHYAWYESTTYDSDQVAMANN
tara:strand:- start:12168 stop:12419 length:252 start_codon:yes stop_codon:yes gene_type:complete